MSGPAPRYARALLEALSASGELEKHLPKLQALAKTGHDVEVLLGNVTIPVEKRSQALSVALGSPAGILDRLIKLLASRRRLGLAPVICAELVALYEKQSGLVRGTVESRQKLSETQLRKLEQSLSVGGKTVRLESKLSASLLGGFRVRVGDTVLDATADNQLNQARKALLSA